MTVSVIERYLNFTWGGIDVWEDCKLQVCVIMLHILWQIMLSSWCHSVSSTFDLVTGLPGEDRWRRSLAVLWGCCRDIARVSWSQFSRVFSRCFDMPGGQCRIKRRVESIYIIWYVYIFKTGHEELNCICASLSHLLAQTSTWSYRYLFWLSSKHLLCGHLGMPKLWRVCFLRVTWKCSVPSCLDSVYLYVIIYMYLTNTIQESAFICISRLLFRVCEETVRERNTHTQHTKL